MKLVQTMLSNSKLKLVKWYDVWINYPEVLGSIPKFNNR